MQIKILLLLITTIYVGKSAGDHRYYSPSVDIFANILPHYNYSLDLENVDMVKNATAKNCLLQLNAIFDGVKTSQQWAMEVADAWGKIPSGVLQGNLYELGDYDECLQISHFNATFGAFNGRYCLANVKLNPPPNNDEDSIRQMDIHRNSQFDGGSIISAGSAMLMGIPVPFKFGICVPETCSPELVEQFLEKILISNNIQNMKITPIAETCESRQALVLSDLDKITLAVFTVIAILMTFSTIYDIICTKYDKSKSLALIAFSVYTNGAKLFRTKNIKSPDVIDCIHGIRALSIFWVVYGHTFYGGIIFTSNLTANLEYAKKYYNLITLNAFVAVDSFFFLSGFFVAWSMLKYMDQHNGSINIFKVYVHRYLRLTPLLAVTILFYITLFKYVGDGPAWKFATSENIANCEKHWWSALLYIQNYHNPNEICLPQTWYLSVDTQLFVVAPLFIYFLYYYKTKIVMTFVILIGFTMVHTISVYQKRGFSEKAVNPEVDVQATALKNELIYYATHVRMAPWLIGVIFGYMMLNLRGQRVPLSKITVLILWVLMLTGFASVFISNYPLQQLDDKSPALWHGIYSGCSRVIWPTSLGILIFICSKGYGSFINWFLSWPEWRPISHLSYAIYILHFPIMCLVMLTIRKSQFFSNFVMVTNFLAILILTIFVSIIASLAFESPIITLEKLLIGNNSVRKPVVDGRYVAENSTATVFVENELPAITRAKTDKTVETTAKYA